MKSFDRTELDVVPLLKLIKDSWRILLMGILICQAITWFFLEQKTDKFSSKIFVLISNAQPLSRDLGEQQELTLLDFQMSFRDQTNFKSWLEVNPKNSIKLKDVLSENVIEQVTVNNMEDSLLTFSSIGDRGQILVRSSDLNVLQEVKNYADHTNQRITERALRQFRNIDKEFIGGNDRGMAYPTQFFVRKFINNLAEGQQVFTVLHPTAPQIVGRSKALIIVLSGFFSAVSLLLFLLIWSQFRDGREVAPR